MSYVSLPVAWFRYSLSVALNYEYVIKQQPIGKRLFWSYCKTKEDLSNAIDFLDSAVRLILSSG